MSAKSKIHPFSIPFGIFIMLMTFGCGSITDHQHATESSGNGTAGITKNFSVPLPLELAKYAVSSLSAEVIIDKGTTNAKTTALTVDTTTNKVTGTIENVAAGTHTFEIVYYITVSGTKIEVATTNTKTATVAAGTTTPLPSFEVSDLHYTDTDKDGFTNLAELDSGTECNNATKKPAADLPRSSANYVLNDTMGISPADGKTTVVGSSSSPNYTLN